MNRFAEVTSAARVGGAGASEAGVAAARVGTVVTTSLRGGAASGFNSATIAWASCFEAWNE